MMRMKGVWIGLGLIVFGVFLVNVWVMCAGFIALVGFAALNREPRAVYVANVAPQPVPRGGGGRHILVQSEMPEEKWPMPWQMGLPLTPDMQQFILRDVRHDSFTRPDLPDPLDPFAQIDRDEWDKVWKGVRKKYDGEVAELKARKLSPEEEKREKAKLIEKYQYEEERIKFTGNVPDYLPELGGSKKMFARDFLPFRRYGAGGPFEKIFAGFPINIVKYMTREQFPKQRKAGIHEWDAEQKILHEQMDEIRRIHKAKREPGQTFLYMKDEKD